MTVFINNIKRIFRRKTSVIVFLVAPIILSSFLITANSGKSSIRIGIIDNDKTELTEMMTNNLKGKYDILPVSEGEIQRKLVNNTVEYVLVIDKGFTEGIIRGDDPRVKSYYIKETNTSAPLKLYIDNILNSAKNIAKISGGDTARFYSSLDLYKNGSFTVDYKKFTVSTSSKGMTLSTLGLLIMGMLFLTTFATTLILEDKKSRTFYRMLSTPLTAASYMLQNILSFIVVSIIQIIVMFFFVKVIFKGDLGPSIMNMFVVFLVFAIVCVSIGVAVTSISKDSRQANAISTLINVPVTMLGGCYWPRDIMPDLLKRISDFVPTTWALKAAEKVINGGTLLNASVEIGIMLLFALVFFMLSSWKKTDIAK